MIVIFKLLLATALVIIFVQDVKERQVYWFLFPLVGVCCGILHFKSTLTELFLTSCIINFSFILFLLMVVKVYSKFKLNLKLKDVFGLGDLFLFLALIFSFSSISFIITFIFSLLFSLVLHQFNYSKKNHNNVPLAGYMCLFYLFTYLGYWSGLIDSVYNI
ncbi:general secretion pathway protein [Aquaticitalea lipolytica]|uniref:General secretion pathway protein n=1 Tax=Aquaticitalea lipolytica TaxID=1247562 RepID=A0A8J2XHD7_9FLAO|nr:general secretion pathway protein [Aquaticitalea lipolytica]